jgi:hypothetical protein
LRSFGQAALRDAGQRRCVVRHHDHRTLPANLLDSAE